jgi:hypothetical protein
MNILKIKFHLLLLFSIILSVLCQNCKKTDVVTETERVRGILESTSWKINTANVDGVDQTSTYVGLVLNFSSSNYTSVNGGVVWPASGTWKFSDDSGKNIDRSDGLKIIVNQATSSTLILTFNWDKTTLNGGRVESVKGQNIFSFQK